MKQEVPAALCSLDRMRQAFSDQHLGRVGERTGTYLGFVLNFGLSAPLIPSGPNSRMGHGLGQELSEIK